MKKKFLILIVLAMIISIFVLAGCDSENNEEDFVDLESKFIDYEFKTKERTDSFYVEGEYDLNNDGTKDKINLELQKNTDTMVEAYIEVNGIKEEIYMSFTMDGETRLIDLDEDDEFIEVAYFDEGPSGDPTYYFYRYDGEDFYKLGELDDKGLIDGQGKLIAWIYQSNFEPAFYSAWYEIENKEFTLKEKDTDQYLGKDYRLNESLNAMFEPMDEMPDEFYPSWDDTYLKDSQGIDLKLIDISKADYDKNLLNFYFVELEDGEKGMLYFWIGD